ncbi:MAG: hypothetical protein AVDCRST_MAG83-3672, partial [uncultured Arthrobacter sp.]
ALQVEQIHCFSPALPVDGEFAREQVVERSKDAVPVGDGVLLGPGGRGGRGYSIGWTEVPGPTTMEETNGRKT